MWVDCPCGWKMKIYNFSLDVVLCAFCRDVVSEPNGKNIKLADRVSEELSKRYGKNIKQGQ